MENPLPITGEKPACYTTLTKRLGERTATVAVIGLGYVGLPLARALGAVGYRVIGYDIDPEKVELLNAGQSYFTHFSSDLVTEMRAGRFEATCEIASLSQADAILICVPTPLSRNREPDLSYVVSTAESLVPVLKPGVLVALESTTYPGTTSEVLKPILERSGLKSEQDLFIAYSPEREDPGNVDYDTSRIPKVVGGEGPRATAVALELYRGAVIDVIPVKDTRTTEAVKLTENIFRSVNIALVNELKLVYDAMGIDVWDVIEAASSKPFGFMPFYPGPGLGGHCIPIDPFYLTWKAREFDAPVRFVELAGEINTAMPRIIVDRITAALNDFFGKGVKGTRILLIGIAYKKDVDDIRESPALKITELLEERGAETAYHDPFVEEIGPSREHSSLAGRRSINLDAETVGSFDAILIITDHSGIDWQALVASSRLVVDTRNATRNVEANRERIVKA